MLRFLKYCCILFLFLLTLLVALGAGSFYYFIVLVPAPETEETAINEILGRESPVFYRDGQTKLGVIFEGIHRQYVSYEAIPKAFVNALLAAEDKQFFHHIGLDISGIIRASIVNLKAGRVVQGGSTITQQTAKNLFKRESRSIRAKLKELVYALRLERKYSKEKIFEFYANQFFVSGNGHGLGVAARYFFDKEPEELTVLECAFIAGSVKRPNYYNPFLKKNLANAEEVRQRINERVRYVLGQMRKEGMISEAEYASLQADELVFKQGKMGFSQSTAMDLVREGVETPFIADALEENGISNISTSGARIITSLDPEIQNSTMLALRKHLSQLDVRLRGYKQAKVQSEYNDMDYRGDEEISPGNFLFGLIAAVQDTRDKGPEILVHFDDGRFEGLIDANGLTRLANAYAMHTRGAGAATMADRKALVRQMKVGDKVYTSVRAPRETGGFLLDLERYPKVEGAAFVVQEGAIRAMSGGMSNLNFNRATTAKRLMGSTFKPFLLTAALQLGWSPVDMISNSRQTFVFSNRPYSPQPDHNSPFSSVSLSWAGVTSENVAVIWLLYHLTDHLTLPMIRELAAKVDMAPRVINGKTEDMQRYRERMRDSFGIIISRQHLDYAAYAAAVRTLQPDFIFDGREDEYSQLQRMRFDDFHAARSLIPALQAFRTDLAFSGHRIHPDLVFEDPESAMVMSGGRMARNGAGRFVFTLRQNLPDHWIPVSLSELIDHLTRLDAAHLDTFWQNHVLLDGTVTAATVQQVEQQLHVERGKLGPDKLYSLDVLAEVRDFRVMLGLQYLVQFAKECGVNSRFEPVLSSPLGSNVVSLSELTRMYETLITGFRYDSADASTLILAELDGKVDPDSAAIIERIETPEGQVVYSRQPHKVRVVDAKSAAATANILQNVIPYGTGRYALKHVKLHSENAERKRLLERSVQSYPLLGKTGTANEYRNSAFVGYVPILNADQSGLTLDGGYTVGVYAGYDHNAPMVSGRFRVSGAVGALPAWSAIAQSLLDTEQIADRIDIADLAFNGLTLQYPDVQQVFLPVLPQQGGAVRGTAGLKQTIAPKYPASLCFGDVDANGRFQPKRLFMPYWKNQ
ncbi:MAG: glycosyl transferase family 51 [Desulfobulbus sp.]|nr:glycosyl transferase family 51 [Desulfobulbus sp.]